MLTGRWKSFKIVEKLRTGAAVFRQTPAAAFVEFLFSNKREQVEFRQTSRVNDSNKEPNNGFFNPKRHSAVYEVAIIAPGERGGGVKVAQVIRTGASVMKFNMKQTARGRRCLRQPVNPDSKGFFFLRKGGGGLSGKTPN